jgi:predicted metal-dependent peptidase
LKICTDQSPSVQFIYSILRQTYLTIPQKEKDMPPKKKDTSTSSTSSGPQLDNSEDFSAELIKQLNREAGDKIAFNLGDDDAPTNVRRWVPTGSKLLDYAISNKRGGGFPEGRIIEIQGPPSCGKSLLRLEKLRW